jgi:WD40 repeat protein
LFYANPVPVLALASLADGQHLAIGGYHEVLLHEVLAEPSAGPPVRLTNLPERIHALLPADSDRRIFYVGGNPGRLGEAGVIERPSTGANAGSHSVTVLTRSGDSLLALAMSPDGRSLAVGGADNWIRVLDPESGEERRRITQHADWVMGLAFHPDGTRIASASRDGTARIFDLATGDMISAFREHDGAVFDVVFIGNGSQAASAGRDGRVRFWSTTDGNQKSEIRNLGGEVFKLVTTGEDLLGAGADGGIRRFSIADRKVTQTWRAPGVAGVISFALLPDEKSFVVGRSSGVIEVWPLEGKTSIATYLPWPMRDR